jgi:hypothetical protein
MIRTLSSRIEVKEEAHDVMPQEGLSEIVTAPGEGIDLRG